MQISIPEYFNTNRGIIAKKTVINKLNMGTIPFTTDMTCRKAVERFKYFIVSHST